ALLLFLLLLFLASCASPPGEFALASCASCGGKGRMGNRTCPTCQGSRLKPESVAVTIDGRLDVQSRLENSTHYFFYLDRPGGGYNLKVMGSEPVPEFEPTLPILVSLFIAVIVHTRRRSSPRVE
ncbi:MAG: hypothetical protein QW390_03230, partial [Candidatus Bathyarchaeia archaeon]